MGGLNSFKCFGCQMALFCYFGISSGAYTEFGLGLLYIIFCLTFYTYFFYIISGASYNQVKLEN